MGEWLRNAPLFAPELLLASSQTSSALVYVPIKRREASRERNDSQATLMEHNTSFAQLQR